MRLLRRHNSAHAKEQLGVWLEPGNGGDRQVYKVRSERCVSKARLYRLCQARGLIFRGV